MKYVIRAGGVGSRLWPYSRGERPKQFHAMVGDRTMIQDAVRRIESIAEPGDVHISVGAGMEGLVREQLPELEAASLIVEPALRNTGPAVGLECALLEARFPGCTIASLGSDHFIGQTGEFCRLLQVAETALVRFPDYLFTIGIKPSRVETGYGHIRKGSILLNVDGEQIFTVDEFTEKPDLQRARQYTDSGNYLWNSNMFVWKAATILNLFERYEPEIYATLQRIGDAVKEGTEFEVVAAEYPLLKSIAVDNAIIERAECVATLEGNIDWGDIGSWAALTDVLPTDADGNLFNGFVEALDVSDTTAYGSPNKLIALIGVEDLVVVDTADALLVCGKNQAQRVKEIVDRIEESREDGQCV